jgi:hypothetical protein
MPAPTGSPQSRPHIAPAHYPARPASLQITALYRRPQQRFTHRVAADPAGASPAQLAANG